MHRELGSWQRAWRRVGKAKVQVEVDADMVEEKLEEEEDEDEEEDSQPRRRRRTTLIKSNNPHLAGGEKQEYLTNFRQQLRQNLPSHILCR